YLKVIPLWGGGEAGDALVLGPQIEQLDLLGGHARLVGEALDDGAGRHEMRIGSRGKRDRVAAHLACRSDPIRDEHEGSLAHHSLQWRVFQSRIDGGRARIDSFGAAAPSCDPERDPISGSPWRSP